MSQQPTTLAALIKTLFPLPDQPTLLNETSQNCPFANLGMRGGYGETRRQLVSAILEGSSREHTEDLYHQLVNEGLLDEQADLLCDGEPTEIEFLARRLSDALIVGKTYLVVKADSADDDLIGQRFEVCDEGSTEHEFCCHSNHQSLIGLWGKEDFRNKLSAGWYQEVLS